MSEGGQDDRSLVERYLRGDPDAYGDVRQWILVALRARYASLFRDHEDLAQTIHEKLVGSLRRGHFDGRGLRPYVIGVVHNAVIDHLRRVYRHRLVEEAVRAEPAPVTNPYRKAHLGSEMRHLYLALQAVPRSCRSLWRLLFVERLSYAEIGERLSVPVGTIKSRMWHCRRKATAALRRLRLSESARAPPG